MRDQWTLLLMFFLLISLLAALCVRGLVKRKPFVISGYRMTAIPTTSMALMMFPIATRFIASGSVLAAGLLFLVFGFFLVIVWSDVSPYTVIGFDHRSVDGALRWAVQQEGLAYNETGDVSRIGLQTIGAEIEVKAWMGFVHLKVTPRKHKGILLAIATRMTDFKGESTALVRTSVGYGIAAGAVSLVLVYVLSL